MKAHRLAKYIAMCGFCSRRAAERFITQGVVTLNQQLAKHTDLVTELDIVHINEQKLNPPATHAYMLYHKPVGIDCNNKADDAASLYHVLNKLPMRLFAVGRLDKDSSGLLLLTNDGELSQRLMHPSYYHEKGYVVTTDKNITEDFLKNMATGVSWQLGDNHYVSRPCKIEKRADNTFYLILTQGLNRQIRYMCKALGFRVISLKRERLGNLELADLAQGELRALTDSELNELKRLSFSPQPQA